MKNESYQILKKIMDKLKQQRIYPKVVITFHNHKKIIGYILDVKHNQIYLLKEDNGHLYVISYTQVKELIFEDTKLIQKIYNDLENNK